MAVDQWQMGLHGHALGLPVLAQACMGLYGSLLGARVRGKALSKARVVGVAAATKTHVWNPGVDHPMWVSVHVGCLSHVGWWAGGILSKDGQVGRWAVFERWVGGLVGCWAVFKR
jgi:hypothetical protein